MAEWLRDVGAGSNLDTGTCMYVLLGDVSGSTVL